MNIPVVLPVLGVVVNDAGQASLTLNGEPYGEGATSRADIPAEIQNLATELGGPVRVEVTEADGTRYVDIALPAPAEDPPSATPTTQRAPAETAAFVPGEDVALAYLLWTRSADTDGAAHLGLPPALIAAHADHLVLLGMGSGAMMRIGDAG